MDILTPKDVAMRLKISLSQVYSLVQNEEISYFRIRSAIRFQKSDIEAYISNHGFKKIEGNSTFLNRVESRVRKE